LTINFEIAKVGKKNYMTKVFFILFVFCILLFPYKKKVVFLQFN